jgi:hypothetical protein
MVMKLDRRGFLMATGASFIASISDLSAQRGNQTRKPELAEVKACVFDTFGTVVDWRTSVIAEAQGWGQAKGFKSKLGGVHGPLATRLQASNR